MNRIKRLFKERSQDILNIYFTAGHPGLNDTVRIIKELDKQNVDLVEVGMPYSDPLADGETIQNSSQIALRNGMSLNLLFDHINEVRKTCDIPLIMMGYYNQMIQYGEKLFLKKAKEVGVDGMIIPDLPMDIYESKYLDLFETLDLAICFLITPETSEDRIRQADRLSSGFIYVVSKSSITGSSAEISHTQKSYFDRLKNMGLNSPSLIGFGIHDKESYLTACANANGAIIGSAFIRALDQNHQLESRIADFITSIR